MRASQNPYLLGTRVNSVRYAKPTRRGGTVSSLIKRLTREVFRHHSNPWSAWTRLLSVPLVFVPIWTRSWRQGAIVGVWLIVNPIVFREPKNDEAWATRAMLGEGRWIAERPLDRADGPQHRGDGVWSRRCRGSLQATSVADGGMHGRAGGAVGLRIGENGRLTTNATAANVSDLSRREVPRTPTF